MKKHRASRAVSLLICISVLISSFYGCGKSKEPVLELADCAVQHEEEFGGVYILSAIDDFNAKGFAYGDSVTVKFSNGYTLKDIPYYNGYYTLTGDPLLIAYPGYPYIKAAINNGDDLFDAAGLNDNDTATVILTEKGKYAAIQNARDIHYSDNREDYESDVKFANFRSVKGGEIAKDVLFRSASPCDNQHNRAAYVDYLMDSAGVKFILNLSDNEEKINGYIANPAFLSSNFLSLYKGGKVKPIALNMNYGSDEFRKKIVEGLSAMAESEGPYLIHCTEGKDRTGFVCMLIEALCGTDYLDIVYDYMITYDNYYKITESSKKEQYDIIVDSVFVPMIRTIAGKAKNLEDIDLAAGAEKYLLDGGMSSEQISLLKNKLTGK